MDKRKGFFKAPNLGRQHEIRDGCGSFSSIESLRPWEVLFNFLMSRFPHLYVDIP